MKSMKRIMLFSLIISFLLSCSKDDSLVFSPSSLEFDSAGGVSVLSMKGNAASSTEFCGFYGVSENGIFRYCTTEEQVRQNSSDGSLISVSCYGLTVSISNNSDKEKNEYSIEASNNNTGTPKEYCLQFSHGNEMITYIVKQK